MPSVPETAVARGRANLWPPVAVVMVVRNEARLLRETLASVLSQNYPGQLEVVIAVGPSSDGTELVAAELAREDSRVTLVTNPSGWTPAGLNAAVAATSAPVVARADGHALLPDGYLKRAVEVLQQTGAVNVGGVMAAEGTTPFERTVAAAMSSPFGVGGGRFHYGGEPGPADSVYLGVFRREALVGGAGLRRAVRAGPGLGAQPPAARSRWVGVVRSDLRVSYRPRHSLHALARQYYNYGRWRRVVMRRHRNSVRWTYLVPPITVTGLIAGIALAIAGRRAGLLAPAAYAAANIAASTVVGRRLPVKEAVQLPVVFATMHLTWGWGFLTSPRRLGAHDDQAPSRPSV